MDQPALVRALSDLPLGRIRYFETIGSTNDLAADWAAQDAPDLSLIIADEQTHGRGRAGRRWFTPPGSALAFSLILRPAKIENKAEITRVTGLGAIAVCQALEQKYRLEPKIKWPNDILLAGKKACGVLVEAHWQGEQLIALILGIGINIAPSSVPSDQSLNYPATSVESVLGTSIDRTTLLREILEELVDWQERLSSPDFIGAWESRLAYRDQTMQITLEQQVSMQAKILGLDHRGRLRLRSTSGEETVVQAGEIQMHPIVDSSQNRNTLK
jgi:BirA family biotin operon repressor/biotin-[acetyl-CoA-carboxylase] ligase